MSNMLAIYLKISVPTQALNNKHLWNEKETSNNRENFLWAESVLVELSKQLRVSRFLCIKFP